MTTLQLLIDLHRSADRQGPGSAEETKRAILASGLDRCRPLKIADIGCGTGASTIVLAKELNAEITAVDFLPEFLEELACRASAQGVSDRIHPLCCSMDSLPFGAEEFDVIWSEGAVYNMGFEAGVSSWSKFLKPGGVLAVSEISWITAARPKEIEEFWTKEYPEIDLVSAKMSIMERSGLSPLSFFTLPSACWLDSYYNPMVDRFESFLDRHQGSHEASRLVEAERHEIALYHEFGAYYGYGFYVACKQ
jgi:SAM-dependent methyltransferase